MSEICSPLAGHNSGRRRGVYAIALDLDAEELKKSRRADALGNAHCDISRFLRRHGFERMQGSVYFGDESVNAVTCQTAVGHLALEYEWFARSVREVRMLRIEDDDDLAPIIELTLKAQAGSPGRIARN